MVLPRASQCLRHPDRPAVARCRSCGQSYCRECVVEHEHRLMCAACLVGEAGRGGERAGSVPWAALVQWAVAAGVLWVLFCGVAAVLRRVPAEVHDGLIWKN